MIPNPGCGIVPLRGIFSNILLNVGEMVRLRPARGSPSLAMTPFGRDALNRGGMCNENGMWSNHVVFHVPYSTLRSRGLEAKGSGALERIPHFSSVYFSIPSHANQTCRVGIIGWATHRYGLHLLAQMEAAHKEHTHALQGAHVIY